MDHLFPLLLYFACTLLPSLTRLASYTSFDHISTGTTVAACAKLDLQYGVAHSSHVVLVTCVKNLYTTQFAKNGSGIVFACLSSIFSWG